MNRPHRHSGKPAAALLTTSLVLTLGTACSGGPLPGTGNTTGSVVSTSATPGSAGGTTTGEPVVSTGATPGSAGGTTTGAASSSSSEIKMPRFQNDLTKQAYGYLLDVLAVPRCSHHEEQIGAHLMAFGEELGLETTMDEAGNILIRKPGSTGREGEQPITLQAHQDMVCVQDGTAHDFSKDPIIPVVTKEWLTASGTSLGADDGAGMSMIMAILAADDISHPPLEALFTTNEEDGMTGAAEFDVSALKSGRILNLDSETEGSFTVSSASSVVVDWAIPVEWEPVPAGAELWEITISGLLGGHSGVDIDKGRANAIVLMGKLLAEMPDAALVSFSGGTARNAIPTSASAVIAIPKSDVAAYQALARSEQAADRLDFAADAGITIGFTAWRNPASQILAPESQAKLYDALRDIPNGVQTMSAAIEGLVESSSNLGVVTLDDDGDELQIVNYSRSSSASAMEALLDRMAAVAAEIGYEPEISVTTPAWEYREDSPLRDGLAQAFEAEYGHEPIIEALHAGLECAQFAAQAPEFDILSIGPTINHPHSTSEAMDLDTYDRTVGLLVRFLAQTE